MATVANGAGQAFAPVLAALATMQGNVSRTEKAQAHEFLEKFQKSIEAWTTTHAILQSPETSVESKLFAATTLKGKITYDLDQLPADSVVQLRNSVLTLLVAFRAGPRPIRTQLCVCLAGLAIQMTTWDNVLGTVGSTLGNEGGDCILEFLKILPEEVTDGRKINLTEDQLTTRTIELLENNADQVLLLLARYAQSSVEAASNPLLFECITSWVREIPAFQIVNSPLLDIIIKALDNDRSFDAAVDTVCAIYRETFEVDSSMDVIQRMYPRIIALRPKIREAAETEDSEMLRGLTRVFAEAGEAWVVLIARMPQEFYALVDSVLECCALDTDRDAISITFIFWYQLKQYLTIEQYRKAREDLNPLFSRLVDVMIKHLEFPTPDNEQVDLFDGDREQEERFREFRHAMGDVLKDCCAVIGVTECLGKSFSLIQTWIAKYAPQATNERVPHWQELEAPLFSMRAMGSMVDPEESTILPQVIPLIVQIPDQEKIRFQAIMALARYTGWTAQNPQTLEAQLNYIISGFQHKSIEVVQAAALAFRFLGTDCPKLLGGHISLLHNFYLSVIDKLKPMSKEEVTEGVAAVIAVQPLDKIYGCMKLFCDPIMQRIMALADNAKNEEGERAVADHVQLITIFIQFAAPYVSPDQENPGVKYCEQILPVLDTIVMNFTKSMPIIERVCRCWRSMIVSYRNSMIPLLPSLAHSISVGFEATREGSFLWTTAAVIREFSDGAEFVDPSTSNAVYQFFEQETVLFLRILNDLPPNHLPDMVEDFFRLVTDAVRCYPQKAMNSPLASPIFSAALSGLSLQQVYPLIAVLHYLHDVLSFGTDKPSISTFPTTDPSNAPTSGLKGNILQLLAAHGAMLVQRLLTGMMYTFPEDVLHDASGVMMTLFTLLPHETAAWVDGTIALLPPGSMKAGESERLLTALRDKVERGDGRKIRIILQDFTNSYRRRNVAPREGLGRLEAARFHFDG